MDFLRKIWISGGKKMDFPRKKWISQEKNGLPEREKIDFQREKNWIS